MKTRVYILLFLLLAAAPRLCAQCGYLAGKVTDLSGANPLVASLSAKTDQGKLRLGKSDSLGVFKVEMPCQLTELIIECPQFQTQHIPVNINGRPEGTFSISLAMMPLGKQTSDEPYAQSEQKHFELKDSLKAVSIVRRIEVRDALSDQRLGADICLYYTQKQKKDCFALTTDRPRAEIVFTEKDIVAVEVKSVGYQAYNGNLILDKTDEEPRTYIIKLSRQQTINIKGQPIAPQPVAIVRNADALKGAVASGKTLYFPRSDYKLPVQSRTYLDSVAAYILENKDKGLRITGHTDNVGNPSLNVTLSEYRVRVISRYLIGRGVPEGVIAAAGVGSKYPVRPNDSEENRRLNRRVEVQIIDLDSKSN
ncbi:hypothetical protein GCM10010967_50950 [Dyadobacter beijingensis]|uniref:OmpA-like domain-containing protein n=1 Tax=Dyadobacter beijingensis TaxID=365489 RepID=A0ABQ2II16_9BACT|nr:OmpA family protein [Dyadobacter beijingensis]GGN08969.1 hypothetical protein GCM10010967_50950 [Dyadobacter beijingensis]